jgi:protoporphyrinogen IX oxidase
MTMLWIKSFHIIFMVAWFAGIFYLPRLFVYHAQATDPISIERFKIMERKLFWGIMTPCMILTLGLGMWLYGAYRIGFGALWMQLKLALVAVLIIHHVYLYKLMMDFKHDRNKHSHVFYRWLNEIPALPCLIGITILVVVKPF